MRTITDRADLDSLPLGSIVSDHGRLAARAPLGVWLCPDGKRWEPSVPVDLLEAAPRA